LNLAELNNCYKFLTPICLPIILFVFQIRAISADERGLTSSLGRPYGRAGEVVAVATLFREGVCGRVPQHQQQQQQQRECPPREQSFQCEKDSAITLAVLLALETLLGVILIAFPRSRVCVTAALDLVRAIRIIKTPPLVVADVVADVEAPSTSASAPPPPPTNQVQGKNRLKSRCKESEIDGPKYLNTGTFKIKTADTVKIGF
jgi:hypothetical protein